MSAIRAAFSYFSILPVGTAGVPGADALAFLPLVGIVVGALAGGVAWAVSLVAPHALAVAVAFAALLVLTGALHVDGFMDSCDALFASVDEQRRLEIMKDPRHGTFAIAGFAALSSLWLAALWVLPPALLAGALALCGGVARWAMTLNAFGVPYARAGAFSKTVGEKPSALGSAVWALLFAGGAALYSLKAVAVVPLAALVALLIGAWAKRRLGGGLTGDVYGFGIALTEVVALAAVATLQARG